MTPLLADPAWQAEQAVNVARNALREVVASLDHCISRGCNPIVLEQQLPFIITDTRHALNQALKAQTNLEALQAMERAEEAEARASESYLPGSIAA